MQLQWTGQLQRLTRLAAPCFLVGSIALWVIAPAPLMNRITPLAGALALLCAGLYLGSVLLRILRFADGHHGHLRVNAGQQLARLRKSAYVMTAILLATFAMAVAFYFSAISLLARAQGAEEARLLWMLTLGGLALALGFGKLVIVLVDMVDTAMTRHDNNAGDHR